jgi:hypothetical protein
MKRFAWSFSLLPLLLLNLAAAATQSQKNSQAGAVRATVTDYIESYYTGDASRMERALHPHYLKHSIPQSDGRLRMSETSGRQMVRQIRTGPARLPAWEKREDITVLDIAGDIASAKLVTSHWTDYITLSKWNGQWKIVSVVVRDSE